MIICYHINMGHSHSRGKLDNSFKLGLILNTLFMVFEMVVGVTIGSLTLVSDATHNLSDSLSLVIAWIGNRVSQKPADNIRTFGYGRAAILTALFNASILIGTALFVMAESYRRLLHPEVVSGGVIATVAAIGIVVNGVVALLFVKDRHDLNVRAAFINMSFDALVSLGAVLAGLLIIVTKQYWIDPFVGIVIAVALVFSAIGIVKEATRILLEGVPKDLDLDKVRESIRALSGIEDIDDLHVWTIATNQTALSCHIVPTDTSIVAIDNTIGVLKEMLKKDFSITHATVEAELTSCRDDPHAHA